jgi:soluble lytic murein transglycosylase-like protein
MTNIMQKTRKAIIGMGTNMLRISFSIGDSRKLADYILTYSKVVKMSITAVLMVHTSIALPSENDFNDEIPFESCFFDAAKRYGIEPPLLMALAHIESRFDASAFNIRSDTDWDIGVMQIWSSWLPKLEKYNIRKDHLLDPCVNINIGAWILAENFASHGNNLTSIGAYNAGFSKKNEAIRTAYVEKVLPKLYHYRTIINARKFND